MCGRYFFTLEDTPAFQRLRSKIEQQAMFEYASDEIFPTNEVLVLLEQGEDYTLDVMKWGIDGYQKQALINARSETIAEKKTFQPMLSNRCLIPCNGFYEWIKKGSRKQKIYIHREDTPLFYLAGIYDAQKRFVIVTGESQHTMKSIHDRTPIIIKEEDIHAYLSQQLPFVVDNEHLAFDQVDRRNDVSQQLSLFEREED